MRVWTRWDEGGSFFFNGCGSLHGVGWKGEKFFFYLTSNSGCRDGCSEGRGRHGMAWHGKGVCEVRWLHV